MATPRRIMIFLLELLLYAALLSSKRALAFQGTQTSAVFPSPTYHNVQLASLSPSATCNSSPKGDDKRASLEVIHKDGPCSKLLQEDATSPSHVQRLEQDESRVASIRSRLANNTVDGGNLKGSKTTLPANSGMIFGTGDYFVTAGLGTPKRNVTFIFDTGSGLTWIQCQACKGYSSEKQEPIFNPSLSTSYTNISCNSSSCEKLKSATGYPPECSESTCVYDIQYGDQSKSGGFLAKDKLSLASTDVFDDFQFGCSQNRRCTIPGGIGLLGLGRDEISFVSQTAETYKKVFSYCLPSISSLTGYLSFGSKGGTSEEVKYTPSKISQQEPSFYFLDLIAISVAGRKFQNTEAMLIPTAGTIIDSGTVITRLPPILYYVMRESFREFMNDYPMASPSSILDTCYDFSKYETVELPKISLFFGGASTSSDVEMELNPPNILYVLSKSQVCLAFAGNSDINDIAILGNVQQKTFKVVYDIPGERVGFGQGGCQ